MWSSLLMCVNGNTTKGKVAWLKIQKHKWTDGTGNSLAALAALDSKYNTIKTKDKQDMITDFYKFKMESSQKPDEASAQLQVLRGELGLFTDPHTISDKEVGLRLVASLPGGKSGQCLPVMRQKTHCFLSWQLQPLSLLLGKLLLLWWVKTIVH